MGGARGQLWMLPDIVLFLSTYVLDLQAWSSWDRPSVSCLVTASWASGPWEWCWWPLWPTGWGIGNICSSPLHSSPFRCSPSGGQSAPVLELCLVRTLPFNQSINQSMYLQCHVSSKIDMHMEWSMMLKTFIIIHDNIKWNMKWLLWE